MAIGMLSSDELADRQRVAHHAAWPSQPQAGWVVQDGASARHRVERWVLADGTAAIYRVPGTDVARTEASALYQRATLLARVLSESRDVPTAWPAVSDTFEGRPYQIERCLPGQTLSGPDVASLLARDSDGLLDGIARAIAALHSLPTADGELADEFPPGIVGIPERNWVREGSCYARIRDITGPDGRPVVTRSEFAGLCDLATAAVGTLPEGYFFPITHGDFRGANLLVGGEGPTLTGVIDLELATRWFPESDLAHFAQRTLTPAGCEHLVRPLLAAYEAAAQPPPGCSLRFDWQRACSAATIVSYSPFDASWHREVEKLRALAARNGVRL